jgi:hypothetical protein
MSKRETKVWATDGLVEMPSAPWYVISHDVFMSGWGLAEGKENWCVVPCEDRETAVRVAKYVRTRAEQRSISILAGSVPAISNRFYSLVPAWVDRGDELALGVKKYKLIDDIGLLRCELEYEDKLERTKLWKMRVEKLFTIRERLNREIDDRQGLIE